MKIGVEYYPEHWDRSLWEQDIQWMREAGVKLVRLAEFAWSKLEPTEGSFDFGWLDEIVGLLSKYDIEIVMCTPTNCPPAWLYAAHPETLQTEPNGCRSGTGVRGHRCYTSPAFRKYVERIVSEMCRHYAGCKHIVAWQIDNEVEANYCRCPSCSESLRKWMKNKYETTEAMNLAHRNDVWSQTMTDWRQVCMPVGSRPLSQYNPAFVLDISRWASDSTLDYVMFQAELIRRWFPATPITTNVWLCEHMPNMYDLFKDLSFCSYDNYPPTRIPDEGMYSHAFHLDLMRGIKQKSFWIMEELSGAPGCWMPMNRTPAPGMIKGYSLQAIAHGADNVLHFRWRTAVGGAEMFWHGIIDHSNVRGRKYAEFADLCAQVNALQQLENTNVKSRVAILMSFDSLNSFDMQLQTPGAYYLEQAMLYHEAFMRWGVNVDIVNESSELNGYNIVIAPALYVRNPRAVENIHRFAKDGGSVLITCRSGVKDEANNCIMEQLPADYASICGVRVEEYDMVGNDVVHIRMGDSDYECTRECDILELCGAQSLAVYQEGFYSGRSAITCNVLGDGRVYYVGTVGKAPLCRALARRLLDDGGVHYCKELPERVELSSREGDGKRFVFLFNNDDKEKRFVMNETEITLAPFEMKITEEMGESI